MCILYTLNIVSILKAGQYWPVLFWGIYENDEEIRWEIIKENQRENGKLWVKYMPTKENKGFAINIGISWEGEGRYHFRRRGRGMSFGPKYKALSNFKKHIFSK
jgi:hypothetical protein